jgi:hypothetical protein
MDNAVEQQVKDYVYKNYPTRYGKKELIVEERDNHFRVKSNKDESPIILGKGIII